MQKNKTFFLGNSTIASNYSRSITFDSAHVHTVILSSSVEKTKRMEIAKGKAKKQKREAKKRREKKEGGKTGSKGVSPLCTTNTNFPKERKS